MARQRRLQLETADLDHGQIAQAILIGAQAIGRTEAHAKVAMKDQAEGFPAMIASHA